MTASPWPFSSRFDAADALPASRPGGVPLVPGPGQWRGNWPPMLHSANEPHRASEGTTARAAKAPTRKEPVEGGNDGTLSCSCPVQKRKNFVSRAPATPLRCVALSRPKPKRTRLCRAAPRPPGRTVLCVALGRQSRAAVSLPLGGWRTRCPPCRSPPTDAPWGCV